MRLLTRTNEAENSVRPTRPTSDASRIIYETRLRRRLSKLTHRNEILRAVMNPIAATDDELRQVVNFYRMLSEKGC